MYIQFSRRKPDIIIISGDAYIDHPSFGVAVIARVLENAGFSVAILAQPDIHDTALLQKIGKPRLCYGVTAGNMDSMISNYTALKYPRREDLYSEGGIPGKRPNRAVIAYTNMIRRSFRDVPVIIGGIEASLRRIAHYDYWQHRIRASILEDSNADLLLYGMSEYSLLNIMELLAEKKGINDITHIPGSAYIAEKPPENAVILPCFTDVKKDAQTFKKMHELYTEKYRQRVTAQFQNKKWVILNTPATPLQQKDLDDVYALPFSRSAYPEYKKEIPALRTVQHSVVSHRGCYGNCSFCALSLHQGRVIQSRSIDSIVSEIQTIVKQPSFKGTISDIGGPSANMFGSFCKAGWPHSCNRDCLFPDICANLCLDESNLLNLLRTAQSISGVKHLFIGSGLRLELLLKTPRYFKQIIKHHTSGQMKVAPEHIVPRVCNLMKKPSEKTFLQFIETFYDLVNAYKKKYYIIPYYMCAHPGCTDTHMRSLQTFNKKHHIVSHQIQIFTPTPMTDSTCMYYTQRDRHGNSLYCAYDHSEKRRQKSLLLRKRSKKNR